MAKKLPRFPAKAKSSIDPSFQNSVCIHLFSNSSKHKAATISPQNPLPVSKNLKLSSHKFTSAPPPSFGCCLRCLVTSLFSSHCLCLEVVAPTSMLPPISLLL
ncbi:unnamed protein product [Cuscuta europaea]|uniref:Uncharacterized protein n=1 Tax=Cuscuta europaea TaxID=41803 RepID=A0A9P0YUS1_CUSEU|nr:unnamed protein product [Cuscuta europaea]